jgi:hypothetical protein
MILDRLKKIAVRAKNTFLIIIECIIVYDYSFDEEAVSSASSGCSLTIKEKMSDRIAS